MRDLIVLDRCFRKRRANAAGGHKWPAGLDAETRDTSHR
jgi:hypothetical protein